MREINLERVYNRNTDEFEAFTFETIDKVTFTLQSALTEIKFMDISSCAYLNNSGLRFQLGLDIHLVGINIETNETRVFSTRYVAHTTESFEEETKWFAYHIANNTMIDIDCDSENDIKKWGGLLLDIINYCTHHPSFQISIDADVDYSIVDLFPYNRALLNLLSILSDEQLIEIASQSFDSNLYLRWDELADDTSLLTREKQLELSDILAKRNDYIISKAWAIYQLEKRGHQIGFLPPENEKNSHEYSVIMRLIMNLRNNEY